MLRLREGVHRICHLNRRTYNGNIRKTTTWANILRHADAKMRITVRLESFHRFLCMYSKGRQRRQFSTTWPLIYLSVERAPHFLLDRHLFMPIFSLPRKFVSANGSAYKLQ